jgi:hypothetical protein
MPVVIGISFVLLLLTFDSAWLASIVLVSCITQLRGEGASVGDASSADARPGCGLCS